MLIYSLYCLVCLYYHSSVLYPARHIYLLRNKQLIAKQCTSTTVNQTAIPCKYSIFVLAQVISNK